MEWSNFYDWNAIIIIETLQIIFGLYDRMIFAGYIHVDVGHIQVHEMDEPRMD